MQIPQNILEELERRRQGTLASVDPAAEQARYGGGPTQTDADPSTSLGASLAQMNMQTVEEVSEVSPPLGSETSIAKVPPSQGGLFFDYLARLAIFAAIFFTPLFFFNASDILGLPKQLLLSSLALTALAGWVCKAIASGRIVWRRNFLTWAALAVAASAVLSSVFSDSFWVSFLGDAGRYDFAGVSLLAYVIMFIVASQSLVRRDVKAAAGLWLFSSLAVAALAALKFVGFSVLPWEFAEGRLFNTIGGPFNLSLFVLAGLPFAAAVWPELKSRWQKIALALAALGQLALATVIDFQSGWIALATAALFLAASNFMRAPGQTRINADQNADSRGSDQMWGFQRHIVLPAVLVIMAAQTYRVGHPYNCGCSFHYHT